MVVELACASGQLQRVLPLAVMRDDVGEVVRTAGLELRPAGQRIRLGDVAPGALEIARGGLDPRGEQQRIRAVCGRGRLAGSVQRTEQPLGAAIVAEHDPRPPEAARDGQRADRIVCRAPGERGVDVRTLSACEPLRCSAWRALRTPAVDSRVAAANHAA